MVSRREFVSGVGGATVGFFGSTMVLNKGVSKSVKKRVESATGQNVTVDVKLFPTDEFLGMGRKGVMNATYAIETLLPGLSNSKLDVSTNVTTSTTIVTEASLNWGGSNELTVIRDRLTGDSSITLASDSNIVLSSYQHPDDKIGIAEIPDNQESSVGAIFDSGGTLTNSTQSSVSGTGSRNLYLRTLAHEIGHNLGLTHADANAWIENEYMVSTIMANKSRLNYGGKNNFGQKIPDKGDFLHYRQAPVWNRRINRVLV